MKVARIQKSLQTKDYFSPNILRPTLVCVILMFFLEASGAVPILVYTVDIFNSVGVDNSYFATVLVGVTQVVNQTERIFTPIFLDWVNGFSIWCFS